jgi:hypothetical protein
VFACSNIVHTSKLMIHLIHGRLLSHSTIFASRLLSLIITIIIHVTACRSPTSFIIVINISIFGLRLTFVFVMMLAQVRHFAINPYAPLPISSSSLSFSSSTPPTIASPCSPLYRPFVRLSQTVLLFFCRRFSHRHSGFGFNFRPFQKKLFIFIR